MSSKANAICQYKQAGLDLTATARDRLYQQPRLTQLFLELTLRCNERCFHCGSRCAPDQADGLSLDTYKQLVNHVKAEFGTQDIQFCITGGEPMLRPDFFDIVAYIHDAGFHWGMTTNGTLITPQAAQRLKEAGLETVSISIDGLEATHDAQRGLKGGYRLAMQGIENLIQAHFLQALQVTSVFNHQTMDQLEPLYDIFAAMDIDSWRVVGIEPIGRALDHPEKLMTPQDQRRLFDFIKAKREEGMPLCYGCSHYLGMDYERDVRNWYFQCIAGTCVASIDAQGDIRACLDIEKGPGLVQGNILHDRFADVWRNGFELFRQPLSDLCPGCADCSQAKWCAGGAHHTYDYARNEQRICFKDVLF